MLMYGSGRTFPLGLDEYNLVHFMTVDEDENGEESLKHYVVRIYTDATIQVLVNGVDRGPGRLPQIDTMKGATGFGPSPTNPTPHALYEFQIGLETAGFEICCYSPDPAWWSGTTPPHNDIVSHQTDTSHNPITSHDFFTTHNLFLSKELLPEDPPLA